MKDFVGLFSDNRFQNRVNALAYSGDKLGRHLLHHPLLSAEEWRQTKTTKGFDFCHDLLETWVEVKVRNAHDAPGFRYEQLQGQRELLAFPFPDGIALIFKYTGKVSGHQKKFGEVERRRLFSQSGASLGQVMSFLYNNIVTLYAVHFDLLFGFEERIPFKPRMDKGKERLFLPIPWAEFEQIGIGPRKTLKEFRLARRKKWARSETSIPSYFIETEIEGKSVRPFRLIPLLPPELRERFIKQLNGYVRTS